MNTPPTPTTPSPRPWWASILDRAITSVVGIAVMVLSATILPGAGVPIEVWLPLVIGGGVVAGVAPSAIGRTAAPRQSDERGRLVTDLLVVLAAIGLTFLGAVVLGATSGCQGSQYAAQRRATVDWYPGPPCRIRVHLDGQKKPSVTVDAPEACEPAPDMCPAPEPVPQY